MNENNVIEQKTDIEANTPVGVDTSPTAWIWPNRIARGRVTLLTGMPKTGKHILCCWLSAAVSAGLDWPDDDLLKEYRTAAVGTVVLITEPESHVRVVGPYTPKIIADRIARQAGKVDNVFILDTKRFGDETFDILKKADELNKALSEIPDCKLLILDPLDAFVDADLKDAAIAGQVYQVLARIAKDRNIGVVVTDKFSQRRRDEIDALPEHAKGRPPDIHGNKAFVDIATNVWESYVDKTDTRFFSRRAKILTLIRTDCCDSPGDIRFEIPLGIVRFGKAIGQPASQAKGKETSLMTGRSVKQEQEPKSETPTDNSAPEPQAGAIPSVAQQKAAMVKTSAEAIEQVPRTSAEPQAEPDDKIIPTEPQTEPVPVNAAKWPKSEDKGEGF